MKLTFRLQQRYNKTSSSANQKYPKRPRVYNKDLKSYHYNPKYKIIGSKNSSFINKKPNRQKKILYSKKVMQYWAQSNRRRFHKLLKNRRTSKHLYYLKKTLRQNNIFSSKLVFYKKPHKRRIFDFMKGYYKLTEKYK